MFPPSAISVLLMLKIFYYDTKVQSDMESSFQKTIEKSLAAGVQEFAFMTRWIEGMSATPHSGFCYTHICSLRLSASCTNRWELSFAKRRHPTKLSAFSTSPPTMSAANRSAGRFRGITIRFSQVSTTFSRMVGFLHSQTAAESEYLGSINSEPWLVRTILMSTKTYAAPSRDAVRERDRCVISR